MAERKLDVADFGALITPEIRQLLSARGGDLIQQVGLDVVRGVVFDVLTGRNLRDSTEALTRRRIAALNLAVTDLFLHGATLSDDFIEHLPYLAGEVLTHEHLPKTDKWIAQWILGLTDKGVQNILRDNPAAFAGYRDRYIETCHQVIAEHERVSGGLRGILELDSGAKAQINWLLMLYLLNTVGAQTLAIRGSDKSTYGKLFEKLILGSLLHILDFSHVSWPPQQFERVFWLSSQGEKRESDATLLYEAGKGVRFDIGFIGRGNPEISLDKVSRFEREVSLGRSHWYMATIILVDRIGANSRIEALANTMGGTIVQMSAAFWPQQVAQKLGEIVGLSHPLVTMKQTEIEAYLRHRLSQVPLETFLPQHSR